MGIANRYDPATIEPRWQARWEAERAFAAKNPGDPGFDPGQPKHYVLDMFPYPSGSGLHVGHAVGYVGTDAVARRKRMQGCNVLHPMGWDAFGLPAEQYAIQTGVHPRVTTARNTANFRRQLQRIGLSYDWSREIDTSDPAYYRWTQWIFARLYDLGLAYQAEVPVWWCEELKTVLANEEVINGRSERGNHPCVRRPLKQWMLKITAYADRLLEDLDGLDWPEAIKTQQREWIGKSEGAEIRFAIEPVDARGADGADGVRRELCVFSTRPDTLFGATFMVIAPEHELAAALPAGEHARAVRAYAEAARAKSELERSDQSRQKTGVFTGRHCRNPLDPSRRLPIFVADYVLASYGTGAIMGVPGHDERDREFAQAHDLAVIEVVEPPPGTPGLGQGACFTGDGTAIRSGPLDGLPTPQAKLRVVELLEAAGAGRAQVNYRLRDWLFSRQRYWGEPFPVRHRADGTHERVPDEELPVLLPEMEDFRPSADGSPPLARAAAWVATRAADGSSARRDTDTMPGWAGSCWYWLRFMDPHWSAGPFRREAERYWGPVDLYVGGAAHAVMHLLYARFWHKVLYDLGLVSTNEPFAKLFNQGLITALAYRDPSGRLVPNAEVEPRGERFVHKTTGAELEQFVTKMAKQLGNVVNPDEIIAEHGADTLRLYELFMGPLADEKPWNPRDIAGCRRFVERVWRLFVDEGGDQPLRGELAAQPSEREAAGTLELERALNRTVQRVDEAFVGLNLNTAIAALMTFVNEATKRPGALSRGQAERFCQLLAPFAPHLAEELWSRLGHATTLAAAPWPALDARYLEEDEVEIAVQVKGKLRGRARVSRAASQAEVEAAARAAVAQSLAGAEVIKTIYVPGKLVNLLIR